MSDRCSCRSFWRSATSCSRLFVLLISRKASLAAQILFLLLFAAGAVLAIPAVPAILTDGEIGLLQIVQIALQGVAIYFLFTPEARAWFRSKRGGEAVSAQG